MLLWREHRDPEAEAFIGLLRGGKIGDALFDVIGGLRVERRRAEKQEDNEERFHTG
jgi:hypothetical protein